MTESESTVSFILAYQIPFPSPYGCLGFCNHTTRYKETTLQKFTLPCMEIKLNAAEFTLLMYSGRALSWI